MTESDEKDYPPCMKLSCLLSKERIVRLTCTDKQTALEELINVISRSEAVTNPDELKRAIFEREKIMSTGIGLGIAVPHAKIKSVRDFVLALGYSKEGIDYDSLDDKPVHIILMIAGPDDQERYLRILAAATLCLKNSETREAILNAEDAEEVISQFDKAKVSTR